MASTRIKAEQQLSKMELLRERELGAEAGGGQERIARQHAAGK